MTMFIICELVITYLYNELLYSLLCAGHNVPNLQRLTRLMISLHQSNELGTVSFS